VPVVFELLSTTFSTLFGEFYAIPYLKATACCSVNTQSKATRSGND
jgi:hypothetical protein